MKTSISLRVPYSIVQNGTVQYSTESVARTLNANRAGDPDIRYGAQFQVQKKGTGGRQALPQKRTENNAPA